MKLMFVNNVPSIMLMSLVLLANAQRSSNNLRDVDIQELARQNKITKQILEAFIQKKLGLRNHSVKAPSLADILPMKMQRDNSKAVQHEVTEEPEQQQETQEYSEDDSLQSVESEQIDSIYSEGM